MIISIAISTNLLSSIKAIKTIGIVANMGEASTLGKIGATIVDGEINAGREAI
jgi:hypothetical protein